MPSRELEFLDNTTSSMTTPDDYDITLSTCDLTGLTFFQRTDELPHLSQFAAISPASAVNATAIDSQMNYAATNVDKALTEAVAFTTLFAQASARSVLKEKGVDITPLRQNS